ncbi:MAG: cytochrome c biogenesis protein CcsA, partial [Selenomonadaceae bacterium]|nr:cytochrome c biogenesis protein CcsA [Selenomonadaceae bacterium]
MTGDLFLGAGLAFSLGAALLYAVPAGAAWAGRCTVLSAVGIILASACLMGLIFGDHFEIAYVASYSSKELPAVYKFSAFWAGQQGSFLLWLLIHAVVGCILARGRMNSAGMSVYMLLQSLLAILVLAKSPFFPQETTVENGIGLNPLLQDPWMAVHPPVIFLGYAMLAIPLSYSAGALLKSPAAADWLEPARRWTLAAWGFLGAGIFIGGYWAYKVLGWGGYWGWDPVENSSLVPWLMTAVFLHVLKVARVRESVLSMTHLAAIFTFSLVLYGTFLTRSGLLGDFSVHSFAGSSIGLTIASVNAFVLIGGLLLLTVRVNRLPQGRMYDGFHSREFLVLLGMLLTVFLASIIFLGMSMPLFTQLLNHPASVDSSFYVRATMPLAICLMLAMTAACLRFYGEGRPLPKSWFPFGALLIGCAAPLAVGIREILPILLSGVSLMGAAASVQSWKKHALSVGGLRAHIGVGISLFAMVLAENGSLSATQTLRPEEACTVFGHEIVYHGQEFLEDGSAKYYVYSVDGHEVKALTKLRGNGTDAAREPAIDKGFSGDVYIAPSPPEDYGIAEMTLKKKGVSMDGDLAY